jgi:protein-disulfide isomerase
METPANVSKKEIVSEQNSLQEEVAALRGSLRFIALSILVVGILIATPLFFFMYRSAADPEGFGFRAGTVQGDREAQSESALVLDGDPVLGNKEKAKVAIVEFSDYECPFCKQFHQQTFGRLIKEYIDTDQAVFVFRDFPLSGHEPVATAEAQAANCVQEIAGDKAYFEYGQLVFEKSGSNGRGVTGTTLEALAERVGIGAEPFHECVKSEKFRDEIAEDILEGERVGVSGTPAFLIGSLEGDKVVNGTLLVGAQPFSVFKKVLDQYLR